MGAWLRFSQNALGNRAGASPPLGLSGRDGVQDYLWWGDQKGRTKKLSKYPRGFSAKMHSVLRGLMALPVECSPQSHSREWGLGSSLVLPNRLHLGSVAGDFHSISGWACGKPWEGLLQRSSGSRRGREGEEDERNKQHLQQTKPKSDCSSPEKCTRASDLFWHRFGAGLREALGSPKHAGVCHGLGEAASRWQSLSLSGSASLSLSPGRMWSVSCRSEK